MNAKQWIAFGMVLTFCHARASSSTNTAYVTTNLIFFLTRETNGFPQGEFRSDELIFCRIAPVSTNDVRFRTFPYSQAHEFKLFNESGQEVKKTARGYASSLAVQEPKSMSDAAKLHGHLTDVQYPVFRPEDVFVMKDKGAYELEVRLRLWAQTTNSTRDYEIWTRFMEPPNTNVHFGVVVSEPLRVKINKE